MTRAKGCFDNHVLFYIIITIIVVVFIHHFIVYAELSNAFSNTLQHKLNFLSMEAEPPHVEGVLVTVLLIVYPDTHNAPAKMCSTL